MSLRSAHGLLKGISVFSGLFIFLGGILGTTSLILGGGFTYFIGVHTAPAPSA